MKLRPLALGWLLFTLAAAAAQPGPAPTPQIPSLAALRTQLSARLALPALSAGQLGLQIVSLDTGRTLFEHDAHKLLKPASNAKLYSGALALDRLGPDFRIRTSVFAAARPDASGTIAGSLTIYGRGDPSFAARFNSGDHSHSLTPLVEAIVASGVRRITGDLIGDESHFRGPPLGSGWTWDDLQFYYGAEVSALTVEDNVVDLIFRPAALPGQPCQILAKPALSYLQFVNRTTTVTNGGRRTIAIDRAVGENVVYVRGALPLDDKGWTDAVSVPRPALWFVTLLRDALAQRGIKVDGRLRTIAFEPPESSPVDYARLVEVAAVESRPLSEILARMMKPSQNLYAQLLLLQVGVRTQRPGETTEDAGIVELQKFLSEAGIKRGEVLLEEGSGLSRGCLLSPRASVQLLRHMTAHRHAEVFRASLPVAGVDGTLRSRFQGTAAERNVLAKTGSLRYVSTLSGYVTTAAKERLVFSLMLNAYHPTGKEPSGREVIDELAVLLANFSGRSDGP